MRILVLIAVMLSSSALWGQIDSIIRLKPIVLKAYKTHISPSPVGRLDQLSGDSLQRFQAFNLAEALKQNTAVFVKSYGANGVATLSLRGTGASHNKVFWNDLDISPPNLGLMDLSLLQANPFELMQLSYGAGAAAFGSGTIGAALVLNSNVDPNTKVSNRLTLALGSFGHQQYHNNSQYRIGNITAQTSLSFGSVANNFSYRNPGETERSTILEQAGFRQLNLKQNLFWRLKKNTILKFNGWYNESYRDLPPISIAQNKEADQMWDNNLYLNAKVLHFIANHGVLHANLGYVNSSNRFQLASADEADRNDYQSLQSQVRHVYISILGERHFTFENALQARYDIVNSDSYLRPESRATLAYFSKAELRWNPKLMTVGQLRFENYGPSFSPLIFGLHTGYSFAPNYTVSLNISNNYRMPSLNDLYWTGSGNPNLAPEDSRSLEFGFQAHKKTANWYLSMEANAYLTQVENWIQWTPQNGVWQPYNLKSVRNKGIELRLSANRRWTESLQSKIYGNYERVESQNLSSSLNPELEGKLLAYVPGHNYNGGLQVRWANWSFNYQANYQGRFFLDEANYYFMPQNLLQDLAIDYTLEKANNSWQFKLSLHNIADRDYQLIPWRPEPGFNFRIGITWTWGKL